MTGAPAKCSSDTAQPRTIKISWSESPLLPELTGARDCYKTDRPCAFGVPGHILDQFQHPGCCPSLVIPEKPTGECVLVKLMRKGERSHQVCRGALQRTTFLGVCKEESPGPGAWPPTAAPAREVLCHRTSPLSSLGALILVPRPGLSRVKLLGVLRTSHEHHLHGLRIRYSVCPGSRPPRLRPRGSSSGTPDAAPRPARPPGWVPCSRGVSCTFPRWRLFPVL